MFGANFCCGQKVVVAEPRLVETSLLEPSGRGFHLHMYNLRGEVMPKIGGETSFLLALPNGDDATAAHAKLRALVFKYCAGRRDRAARDPSRRYAAALRELRFEGEFCAAEDFAASLVPIMALAGCFGPLDALLQLFPEHNKWSNLADPLAAAAFAWPWDDRAKLRLCAMEAQRLSPGVFGTTLCGNQPVCRRPFSTRIGSDDVAFPAGTKMMLNYRNYGKNSAVFGDETDKWKPYDRPANGGKAPEDGAATAFDARAVMRAPSDDDARRLLGVGPAFDGAP
ncbi:hypothetical protein JL720_4624 [Aureococcus anophagefferens]|nr:hypothetical protein JL720_4624 [Aureococcus anophagefferens]